MRKDFRVYVISAGRYNDLNFTKGQLERYFFIVKKGEGKLYRQAGCKNVIEGGGLMQSRNEALRRAFKDDLICVQLSDDLKKVRRNKELKGKSSEEVDLDFAIESLLEDFRKVNVRLMGVPPTANSFYAKKKISKNTFCIGDCLFVKPSSVFFDTNLSLKEDYDFTLQHIQKYGICFRNQKFLFEFEHYTNKGGAVSYRDDEEEQKNIAYLKAKWGDKIILNKKRANEILIKW